MPTSRRRSPRGNGARERRPDDGGEEEGRTGTLPTGRYLRHQLLRRECGGVSGRHISQRFRRGVGVSEELSTSTNTCGFSTRFYNRQLHPERDHGSRQSEDRGDVHTDQLRATRRGNFPTPRLELAQNQHIRSRARKRAAGRIPATPCVCWCRRGELNPYALAGTRP
jgi:hypothetical protein